MSARRGSPRIERLPSARAPFEAALEPADAERDRLGGALAERRLVGDALDGAARRVEVGAALGDGMGDLVRRGGRTPIGVVHDEVPPRVGAAELVPSRRPPIAPPASPPADWT